MGIGTSKNPLPGEDEDDTKIWYPLDSDKWMNFFSEDRYEIVKLIFVHCYNITIKIHIYYQFCFECFFLVILTNYFMKNNFTRNCCQFFCKIYFIKNFVKDDYKIL